MLVPVTAIAVIDDYLLAGSGTSLEVFHLNETNRTLCWSEQLFSRQAVHGIVAHRQQEKEILALIWGGRWICAVLFSIPHAKSGPPLYIRKTGLICCPDWILDCAVRPSLAYDACEVIQAVLVTAHNALFHVKINFSPFPEIELRNAISGDSVMLYAAHISWLDSGTVIVAAGTAFGQIDIWSFCFTISSGAQDNLAVTRRHFFFDAHDGSIFGIDVFITPDNLAKTFPKALVASCSDDRYIKVWDCGALVSKTPSEDDSRRHQYLNVAPNCFSKTWAHASRIWGVRFLPALEDESNDQLCLLSNGEDATCQLWAIQSVPGDVGMHKGAQLTQLSKLLSHVGKNIWSADFLVENTKETKVVTGGADGGIQLCHIRHSKRVPTLLHPGEDGLNFQDIILGNGQQPRGTTMERDDLKTYCFIDSHKLLVTTALGCIYEASIVATPDELQIDWRYLRAFPELESYSVMAGAPDARICFMAGSNGKVFCYYNGSMLSAAIIDVGRKIGAIFCYTIQNCLPSLMQSRYKNMVFVCVTALGSNEATLAFLQLHDSKSCSVDSMGLITISLAPGFVITSMHVQQISEVEWTVYLGSRHGQLVAYILEKQGMGWKARLVTNTAFELHSDAITAIIWNEKVGVEEGITKSGFLLTTARDSTYTIHECVYRNNAIEVELRHQLALPFGPNIEGVHVSEDKHLIFFGFRGKEFVVYDETSQTEVSSVVCGGPHRVWAYWATSQIFVWTKVSKLHAVHWDRPSSVIVKPGGHGREIKACAIVQVRDKENNGPCSLLATGAEDTDIRIFECLHEDTARSCTLDCVAVLRKHNTGIQQLKWTHTGGNLLSSAGAGEFFVWRVGKIPFVRIGVVCESRLPQISELSDLRITDFQIMGSLSSLWGSKHRSLDGRLCKSYEVSISIIMALSDSTIRQYIYSNGAEGPKWELYFSANYTTCCLTQVRNTGMVTGEVKRAVHTISSWSFTAGTDGCVTAWKDKILEGSTPKLVECVKIHQNTIKAMQLKRLRVEEGDNEAVLIVTAGDDNALGISVVRIGVNLNEEELDEYTANFETVLVPRAHSASITASLLMERMEDAFVTPSQRRGPQRFTLFTTGNDQQVKVWNVVIDRKVNEEMMSAVSIDVEVVCKKFTSVADAATISSVNETAMEGQTGEGDSSKRTTIMVGGVGIEFLVFKL